jgi:8-oxo-dGTP diphosphatase
VLLKTSVGRQEWALPGGGIEKHESDVAAAIRETQEETGLAVKPEQLTLLGEESGKIYRNRNWPRVQFVFYEANVLNKPILKIVRPLEIIELAWFKEDQLPAKSSREVTQALALLKSKK